MFSSHLGTRKAVRPSTKFTVVCAVDVVRKLPTKAGPLQLEGTLKVGYALIADMQSCVRVWDRGSVCRLPPAAERTVLSADAPRGDAVLIPLVADAEGVLTASAGIDRCYQKNNRCEHTAKPKEREQQQAKIAPCKGKPRTHRLLKATAGYHCVPCGSPEYLTMTEIH